MNPSKELLSEVLPHGENTILKIDQEGHWVNIYYEIGGLTEINIYELDYKCKQWAWNQGYMLMSGQTLNSGWCCEVYSLSDNETTEEIFEDNRFIKTYYENFGGGNPVHQACEWIREQKAKS